MTKKEKLILKIIKSQLSSIKKVGKDQEDIIKKLRKDGYGDLHPFYADEMKSGASYTHGYSIGHTFLAENIISLIKMDKKQIKEMIKRDKEIKKENDRYLKKLKKRIG